MTYSRLLILALVIVACGVQRASAQLLNPGEPTRAGTFGGSSGFGSGEVGTSMLGSMYSGDQTNDAWGPQQAKPTGPSWGNNSGNSFCADCSSIWDELTFFAGIDGSKQPQDFGVNANLGAQFNANWGIPVWKDYGIGLQVGTGLVATGNTLQFFEFIGEPTGRTQSYTTIGMFQRTQNGFAYGLVYDFLYETSYDSFALGQWRLRASYDWGPCDQFGITANIASLEDTGIIGGFIPVTLRPISQATAYWRHYWETGAQTSLWLGLSEGHAEHHLIGGPAPNQDDTLVIGADMLAPLSDHFALYGEVNLMMPTDTGTVDAFVGIQWFPGGNAKGARRGRYAPLLPMAAPTSFNVDLQP
ncbi:hypothetical protein ETAA8_38720 [Anatilimnocola aggregata]|uniref:Uncharacterized protein n=1 Tax=Anatilimnocola aggregata TaxID=2528021 RepID=A0A517YEW4_9BACT|nr:DUF6666 family protein [Anatilimnocola aggregata]QDU28767.1 hypothetical protein ETAA8_38720 [Anatilimnocola aggregata]